MINYQGPGGPWTPYYTWKPRKINGKWYWLTTVYRREKNRIVWPHQGYEFGDGFDLLKGQMNYYYEIDPGYDGTIFGDKWRYWCMYNCSPADNGKMCFKTHDDFVARSSKVWLENANGVYMVKPAWDARRQRVDKHEFTIVKLKAKTIKWWTGE